MKKLAPVALAATLALVIAGTAVARPPLPTHGTKHTNRPAPTGEIGTPLETTNPTAPPTDVQ